MSYKKLYGLQGFFNLGIMDNHFSYFSSEETEAGEVKYLPRITQLIKGREKFNQGHLPKNLSS